MQFDTDMASEHRALFEAVRSLLLSFEGMIETKKPRITTYAVSTGGICHLRTMQHGVDIGILKGAAMQDKFNLLGGSGKKMRVLSLGELNPQIVAYYVQQAIQITSAE